MHLQDNKLPRATHDGELNLGGHRIKCAVLEDGTRILTQTHVLKALGHSGRPRGRGENKHGDRLPAFLRGKAIKSYITRELISATAPIDFHLPNGAKALGFRADILPLICEVFLDARRDGVLPHNQQQLAEQAEILLKGLSRIGITALIDEATGYQEVRDRLALQKILDKYLTDEYSKWTKRFSDEFYREIFRLKGIPYPPSNAKRPQYIGHWTNKIVYRRLAPGVLSKLKELNPKRQKKHHQYLTEDYGVPELQQHLSNLIFLMRACKSWNEFIRLLNKTCQEYGDTIPLELEDPTRLS